MALETQVSLEVLRNLTNQPLEWELPDQQLSALLVLADFTATFSQTHHEHNSATKHHHYLQNTQKQNYSANNSVAKINTND
jgi:hypothetical protein